MTSSVQLNSTHQYQNFEAYIYHLWFGKIAYRREDAALQIELSKQMERSEVTRDLLQHPLSDWGLCEFVCFLLKQQARRHHSLPSSTYILSQFMRLAILSFQLKNENLPGKTKRNMSLAYNFLYMLQQSPPDLFHVKSLDSVLTHLSMVRLIEMDIQNQETLIEVPEKVLHELKLNGSISRLQDNLQQIQSIRYESEVDKALVRSELIFSNQQAPQCHMFEALAYEVSKYNNDFQGYKIAKKLELQQSKRNLFPRIEFYTSILLDLINIPTALFDIILLLSQLPHGLKPNRQITF